MRDCYRRMARSGRGRCRFAGGGAAWLGSGSLSGGTGVVKEIAPPVRVRGSAPPRLGDSRRSLLRQLWHGRAPNAPIPEVSTAVAVKHRDARYRRTLAAADVIAFLAAGFVALDAVGDGHLSAGTV